jgi:predicted transcriptional regulator
MNIQAEKLEIIQWLASINDSKTIKQFMLLKRSNEERISVNLSQPERDAIDRGLESIKEGRFKLHEEVREAARKKYPHLFK